MVQVVVFSCMGCGHIEKVAREEYEKTEKNQQPSLKTVNGGEIIYRPVPDSFECPKCKGDLMIRDAHVCEPFDGVIMVAPRYEDLNRVNEEQARLKRAEGNRKRRQEALAILKPNIENNLQHLESLEGKDLFHDGNKFHIDDKLRPTYAKINALVSFIGNAISWSPEEAEALCLGILEDVNLHSERKAVKELLEKLNVVKNPLLY